MKWVTRERPKTDRIACPWLIKRFIDPDAEIIYVPSSKVLSVAEHEEAHSFDAPGATFTHVGNKCSFETLIDRYELGSDPALVRLARIVHAHAQMRRHLPGAHLFQHVPAERRQNRVSRIPDEHGSSRDE